VKNDPVILATLIVMMAGMKIFKAYEVSMTITAKEYVILV
jgi:hypothetical protein